LVKELQMRDEFGNISSNAAASDSGAIESGVNTDTHG
jgi:hypothetical protein